jgi:hypothetical protein
MINSGDTRSAIPVRSPGVRVESRHHDVAAWSSPASNGVQIASR